MVDETHIHTKILNSFFFRVQYRFFNNNELYFFRIFLYINFFSSPYSFFFSYILCVCVFIYIEKDGASSTTTVGMHVLCAGRPNGTMLCSNGEWQPGRYSSVTHFLLSPGYTLTFGVYDFQTKSSNSSTCRIKKKLNDI
jgi:hypothetical protein